MTTKEYLDKLHLYFFEHYDGTIDAIPVIKEENSEFVMRLTVDNPHDFLDWWEAIYIPLDSWMHEYDANYTISGSKVIFSIRKNSK